VILLTTTSFEQLARMQMRALGDEDLSLAVVEHPIGGITGPALAARSATAAELGLAWFESLLEPASKSE
jgi:hypothetical protein